LRSGAVEAQQFTAQQSTTQQSTTQQPATQQLRLPRRRLQPRRRGPRRIDRNGVLILVRSTLLALDHANKSGNYTVLRDIAAPAFQVKHTRRGWLKSSRVTGAKVLTCRESSSSIRSSACCRRFESPMV